jgi:predicted enzyme related to lactoylglutathione lyase
LIKALQNKKPYELFILHKILWLMAKTYGLTHLAIAVNDVERTMKFYQQVFEMQVMYHEKGFVQLTTPECHDILVFEEKKDQLIGQTGGIAHFGFRLKDPADVEEIADKVIDAGGIIIDKGEFVPGSPYVFFKDPDGYEVEVWYELLK